MKYITIEHWQRHQHYKDRRPPWIKLEIEIIEEFDADGNFKKFHPMPDDAKLTFICLLCLRAHFNGKIPFKNENWLKNKLGIKRINLQPLVNAGYISIDSNNGANPAQKCSTNVKSDTPEGEREREREGEDTHKIATEKKRKFEPPKIQDVINYFLENGYTQESAKKAFKYYSEAEPPWTDSKGNKVKSWKQKMIGVWFKEENKEKSGSTRTEEPKTARILILKLGHQILTDKGRKSFDQFTDQHQFTKAEIDGILEAPL